MIGQVISHYRVIEKLGGGGMGVVYKAEIRRRWNVFVVKRVLPLLSIIPTFAPSMRSANTGTNPSLPWSFWKG